MKPQFLPLIIWFISVTPCQAVQGVIVYSDSLRLKEKTALSRDCPCYKLQLKAMKQYDELRAQQKSATYRATARPGGRGLRRSIRNRQGNQKHYSKSQVKRVKTNKDHRRLTRCISFR